MSRPSPKAWETKANATRKKQAIILTVLVALMGTVWLRNFVLESSKSASAQPSSSGEAGETGEAGSWPEEAQEAMPRTTRGEVRIEWPATRTRDLFTLDRSVYVRRVIEVEEPVVVAPIVEAPVVEAPVVPAGPTDEEIAARESKTLFLRATIQGDVPRAFINGRSWRVGDTINGFVVVRIETGSVVLRYKSVEVTLEM